MSFASLPRFQQIALTMKWISDPLEFCESPYGLNVELWPSQREIVGEFYHPSLTYVDFEGNVLPKGPYNEFWLVAGMRSSKTWIEGTFGAIETFLFMNVDYRRKYNIGPNSPAFGLCVASKEQQALDTNFAQYIARLQDSPFFQGYLADEEIKIYTKTVVIPNHKFYVRACSSMVAGEVGRTIKWLCVDEVDRFETTSGPRSGLEMYRLLTKGTRTFKLDGHSFFCGSPAAFDSLSMGKIKESETDKQMYVIQRPTWDMNPEFTYEDFKRDFDKDAFAALRDWAADPQAGTDVYFKNLDMIQWAEKDNVLERMAMDMKVEAGNHNYVLTIDPAGPKSSTNSFGIALGHKEHDNYIIDGVWAFMPHQAAEVDPIKLAAFITSNPLEPNAKPGIVDIFPVMRMISDTWNYPILQEMLRRKGIQVVNNIVRRPHYELFKEALYERKVVMPYYKTLNDEMRGIVEVNVTRVDHPRGGSKDVADCVVQLVNALAEAVSPSIHAGVIVI